MGVGLTLQEEAREPTSLLDIALRRMRRDARTPFLLTLGEDGAHGVTTRSYADVLARSAVLAGALADGRLDPGQRVGCYLPNTPCWVAASLGVWLAGGSIAAVGTLLPAPEATRLLELAGVRTVVVHADAPDLPGFEVLRVDGEGDLLDGCGPVAVPDDLPDHFPDGVPDGLPDESDLAAIFFTSGTTGQPKGIPHSHADMVIAAKRIAGGYARSVEYRPDPAPAHLAPGLVLNPFGHTAGFVRLAFRMWIGRPTVLVPKFSVPAMRAYVERYEPDSLQLTPTMVHMLATSEEDLELRGVKYVTTSTAPLATPTRERFESRFGVPVMQAYGMTEVGTVAQERLTDVLAGRRGPGSVGRVAAGVEVRIRDDGEILVKAKDMPAEFVGGARVPLDEEGWFATGDSGRFEDDILYVTGRVQEKIIAGGLNIYPAEVEDALKRSGRVHDAVVVGVPDERLGERPVAGIVWAGESDVDGLLDEVRVTLAAYKVPRQLFSLDAVPLTPRDKVDRRRAAELARVALGAMSSASAPSQGGE
jgi:acyl-CoA synthetase (AMP-forming)/AMP-acid ligase II